jgi:thioredoxin reductase/bacterioferritin-associated ferredoxin
MGFEFDLAIVGAGPAGGAAAQAAARYGLRTVLLDEQPKAGGQVWRASSAAILAAPSTPEKREGNRLRRELAGANVQFLSRTRVWHIERNDAGWRLGVVAPSGSASVTARGLVIASGAQERVIPVPGWTLPGVIGLAGATALFKQEMIVPGRNTIVAGCGPLLFYVAMEIVRLGGRVAAVVSLNSRANWARALPAMTARPDLLMRGAHWMLSLARAGTPIYWQHAVVKITGTDTIEQATVVPVDDDWAPRSGAAETVIDADSVCLGHGLVPSVDACRLAGADLAYRPELGGWVPVADRNGQTSVPSLWACGDGAGIRGVGAAPLSGQLAALSAAVALGTVAEPDGRSEQKRLAEAFAKASRFGEAMTRLTIMRDGLVQAITPETVVCRCESITRAEVVAEIQSGAASQNAIKSGTRLGMGPCGGKFCGEAAAMLNCAVTGRPRVDLGLPTARPPLRPVLIDALTGDFDYDSLPIPAPAPL